MRADSKRKSHDQTQAEDPSYLLQLTTESLLDVPQEIPEIQSEQIIVEHLSSSVHACLELYKGMKHQDSEKTLHRRHQV